MAKQKNTSFYAVFTFRKLTSKIKNKANESFSNEWHIVFYIKLDNL